MSAAKDDRARLRAAKRARKLRVLSERGSTASERRNALAAAEALERHYQLTPEMLEAAERSAGFEDVERFVVWSGLSNEETWIRDVQWRRHLAVSLQPLVAPKVTVFCTNLDLSVRNAELAEHHDSRIYRLFFVGPKDDVRAFVSHYAWCENLVRRERDRVALNFGLAAQIRRTGGNRTLWAVEASLALGVCQAFIDLTAQAVGQAKADDAEGVELGVRVVPEDMQIAKVAPKDNALARIQSTVFDLEWEDAVHKGFEGEAASLAWEQPLALHIEMFRVGHQMGGSAFEPAPADLNIELEEFLIGSGLRSLASRLEEALGIRTVGILLRTRRSEVEQVLGAYDTLELARFIAGNGMVFQDAWRREF